MPALGNLDTAFQGMNVWHSFQYLALTWLLIGGIVYTLGAVVYITKFMNFWPGKFGFHEVWHIFVILGALAHFIAIAFFIAPVATG